MKLTKAIEKFLNNCHDLGMSKNGNKGKRYALKKFQTYCQDMEINTLTKETIDEYLKYIREIDLTEATQHHLKSSLRVFFTYLEQMEMLEKELSIHLPFGVKPKTVRKKKILSVNEIDQLIKVIGKKTLIAIRDSLMIEMLFNLGLRIGELLALKISDIDLENECVFIKEAKGNKDRLLPMTKHIKVELEAYLKLVRPYFLISNEDEDYLILNKYGKKMGPGHFSTKLNSYAKKAGFEFHIYSHLFRHACAVHLMRNGMGIRYISELLGHESLRTTQIYTQVSEKDLGEKLEKYHFASEVDYEIS